MRMTMLVYLKYLWLLMSVSVLVACGGGGGGGSNQSPQQQTISFAATGPFTVIVGDTLLNPAFAAGSGQITYESSDTTVATVGANGRITGIAAGSVTITAMIAADGVYASASTSVTGEVVEAGSLLPQTIMFSNSGPLTIDVGETLANSANAEGTGAITYTSSNNQVATVDLDGVITGVTAGDFIITAIVAADSDYATASISVSGVVSGTTPPPSSPNFSQTISVGENDSIVTFSSEATGLEFYRSREADCNLNNYASCDFGQFNVVSGQPITDTALARGSEAFYSFKSGSSVKTIDVSSSAFIPVWGHQLLTHDGRIYIIGGLYSGLWGIWSSADGINWVMESDDRPFGFRFDHQVVSFKNKYWLIGGRSTNTTYKSDIWSSVDGVNWIEETAAAEFSPRYGHQVLEHDGKLWLIGGADDNEKNDVWSSEDGITWEEVTNAAAFSPRVHHQVVSFNNKLWLVGGNPTNQTLQDIWSSTDGSNWIKETAAAPFGTRAGHKLIVFNNTIWLLGKYSDFFDIWKSTDGINWESVTSAGSMVGRVEHEAIVFKDELWIIGGERLRRFPTVIFFPLNDVWSSADGASWQRKDATPSPEIRGHQSVSFNNKLWVIGGSILDSQVGKTNAVWSSADGASWQLETEAAEFSPRMYHQVAAFNNRLWLIGGREKGGEYLNDVWSSNDGKQWTLEAENAQFSNRSSFQMVVFNNRLWVIGGNDASGQKNDVWSSADGVSWEQATAAANFSPRIHHKSAVFNNKLWVVGGFGESTQKNDVWSSSDGVTWQEETASASFSPRYSHELIIHNNRLWVIGGQINLTYATNDIWSSADGMTWQEEDSNAVFGDLREHQLVFTNGVWHLIGGLHSGVNDNYMLDAVWTSSNLIDWRQLQTQTISISE